MLIRDDEVLFLVGNCYGHEGRIRRTYYGRPDQIGLTNLVPSSMGEGAWEVGLAPSQNVLKSPFSP